MYTANDPKDEDFPTIVYNPKTGAWTTDQDLGDENDYQAEDSGQKRTFDTGATRDTDEGKLDFEGFLSPTVLELYAEYMHKNRFLRDGTVRDADNWQKGIPTREYMKSGFRHFFDWWKLHRGLPARDDLETALCALLFNVMGYLHEILKEKQQ